jgi:hypothetical protein
VDLDRSEKVGLSYALGQAMAAVFCARYLGASHMLHVDRYAHHFGTRYAPNTSQRPDLIGLAAGGWVVAEAKGRSNAMESALQMKLEDQKRAIRSIEGAPPWVALGCVASFPPPTGQLQIDAFDPAKASEQAIDLQISRDRFMLAYYAPFVAALNYGQPATDADDRLEVVELPGAGVRLGLFRPIADAVRESPLSIEGLSLRINAALERRPDDAFADGSIVEGDWDEQLTLPDESSFG